VQVGAIEIRNFIWSVELVQPQSLVIDSQPGHLHEHRQLCEGIAAFLEKRAPRLRGR
jgi:hypothetical protein